MVEQQYDNLIINALHKPELTAIQTVYKQNRQLNYNDCLLNSFLLDKNFPKRGINGVYTMYEYEDSILKPTTTNRDFTVNAQAAPPLTEVNRALASIYVQLPETDKAKDYKNLLLKCNPNYPGGISLDEKLKLSKEVIETYEQYINQVMNRCIQAIKCIHESIYNNPDFEKGKKEAIQIKEEELPPNNKSMLQINNELETIKGQILRATSTDDIVILETRSETLCNAKEKLLKDNEKTGELLLTIKLLSSELEDIVVKQASAILATIKKDFFNTNRATIPYLENMILLPSIVYYKADFLGERHECEAKIGVISFETHLEAVGKRIESLKDLRC